MRRIPSLVAQVSKPAVSPISKSAGLGTSRARQVWKPPIQQTRRSALPVLCLLVATSLLADGPADNLADKVRPVPPPGTPISAKDRADLEAGLARLRGAIDQTRDALTNKSALFALLPDIQIFEKAVRYAVQ